MKIANEIKQQQQENGILCIFEFCFKSQSIEYDWLK